MVDIVRQTNGSFTDLRDKTVEFLRVVGEQPGKSRCVDFLGQHRFVILEISIPEATPICFVAFLDWPDAQT